MNFEQWYNGNYKKILVIPAIILTLSLMYITIFAIQTGDVINKDVSLTGGSTITIQTDISSQDFEDALSQNLTDFTMYIACYGITDDRLFMLMVHNEDEHDKALGRWT